MILKILKILTVISFLTITFRDQHIGGLYGQFLILGLFFDFKTFILSLTGLMILTTFIFSSFKTFKKFDIYIFLIGGIVLMIPIFLRLKGIISSNHNDNIFCLTSILFMTIYGTTLFLIIKENKN